MKTDRQQGSDAATAPTFRFESVELQEVSDCAALARYLHVDLKTVQGLAQRREIPCRKVGKAYRFFRPAVLGWLCDQTKASVRVRRRR